MSNLAPGEFLAGGRPVGARYTPQNLAAARKARRLRGCPSSLSLPLGDSGLLGPMLPSLLRCAVATTASLASYLATGAQGAWCWIAGGRCLGRGHPAVG